jgi:hypothetical protein
MHAFSLTSLVALTVGATGATVLPEAGGEAAFVVVPEMVPAAVSDTTSEASQRTRRDQERLW